MPELLPFDKGLPSPCEVYGHIWQATGKVPGQYRCTTCKEIGYYPGCVVAVPVQAKMVFCTYHKILDTGKEEK